MDLFAGALQLLLRLECNYVVGRAEAATPPPQRIGNGLDVGAARNVAVNNCFDQHLGEFLSGALREQLFVCQIPELLLGRRVEAGVDVRDSLVKQHQNERYAF